MSEYAIRAESLSKRYIIGRRERYRMLRDVLRETAVNAWNTARMALFDRRRFAARNQDRMIWALDDVSFEVKAGDSVGIIGSNGAGKSTLLKILARVTVPTGGRVRLRGRVGSLLEVGTGFHPELTGRENVYLNGAILGMRKFEIDRKFDEIVAFSEIEQFLDTPVKFYSSGMRVRLAFAVAAHLEPEILLVDEVLAVGDVAFQSKCIGKMGDVVQEGRTVLFVSHNMGAVKALCQKGIYLERGKARYQGAVDQAIEAYLNTGEAQQAQQIEAAPDRSKPMQILHLAVVDQAEKLTQQIAHDQPFAVRLRVGVWDTVYRGILALSIHNNDMDTIILSQDFEKDESSLLARQPGVYEYKIQVPAPLLVPGHYRLSIRATRGGRKRDLVVDEVQHVCPFEIFDNGSAYARVGAKWGGIVTGLLKWECVPKVELERQLKFLEEDR